MKALALSLGCVLLCCAAGAQNAPAPIQPTGRMVRATLPRNPMDQTTCLAFARTGTYNAQVGDLIEIDYRYLALSCNPNVEVNLTGAGSVVPSALGRLPVDEGVYGYYAVGFLFEAAKVGSDTVTLVADGQPYVYGFNVDPAPASDPVPEAESTCLAPSAAPHKVLRPWTSGGPCPFVPKPYHWQVAVGDIVEMDCWGTTGAPCLVTPKIGLSGDGSVVPSPLGCRDLKRDGVYGLAMDTATFFQAVAPGKSKITFKIKGRLYPHVIKVWPAGQNAEGQNGDADAAGDSPDP